MTIEELEKNKIENLNKRFVVCENLQFAKNSKNQSLINPNVFYKLIAGIVFSLLAVINIIPSIFLTSLVSQICLSIFGGLFLTSGISLIIKSIVNYKSLSDEFNKNKIGRMEQYEQELQELNCQLEKINSELRFLNEFGTDGNQKSHSENVQTQLQQEHFEEE